MLYGKSGILIHFIITYNNNNNTTILLLKTKRHFDIKFSLFILQSALWLKKKAHHTDYRHTYFVSHANIVIPV